MSTKKINKNIALLEYGGSHVECMYFQILALKNNGYNVFLICNKSLVPRFPDLTVFDDILPLNDADKKLPYSKKLVDMTKIRRFTRKNKINTIVINTLECRVLTNILFFPLPKVRNYVGIVHYSKYTIKSGTFKWFYRRVKKVFLLSDNLLTSIQKTSRPVTISTFYPIYFPEYTDFHIEKPEGEFWICSPGNIWKGVKDASTLLNAMSKKKLNENAKIILLGPVEDSLKEQIKSMDDANNLIYFDSFVPQNVLDAYLRNCDAIIPLIHSELFNKKYGNVRISGTYNIVYAYKKPMLLEKCVMDANSDFDNISIPYELDNIIDVINYVSTRPKEYFTASDALQNHPYLNIQKQSEKYIDLIER